MDYSTTAKRIEQFIRKNGQIVTWKKLDVTVSDTNEPWKVSATDDNPLEYAVYMLFYPTGRIGKEFSHYIKDSDIPTGTTKAIMTGNVSFLPAQKDVISREETPGVFKEYRLVCIDPINFNGTVLMYVLEFDV